MAAPYYPVAAPYAPPVGLAGPPGRRGGGPPPKQLRRGGPPQKAKKSEVMLLPPGCNTITIGLGWSATPAHRHTGTPAHQHTAASTLPPPRRAHLVSTTLLERARPTCVCVTAAGRPRQATRWTWTPRCSSCRTWVRHQLHHHLPPRWPLHCCSLISPPAAPAATATCQLRRPGRHPGLNRPRLLPRQGLGSARLPSHRTQGGRADRGVGRRRRADTHLPRQSAPAHRLSCVRRSADATDWPHTRCHQTSSGCWSSSTCTPSAPRSRT